MLQTPLSLGLGSSIVVPAESETSTTQSLRVHGVCSSVSSLSDNPFMLGSIITAWKPIHLFIPAFLSQAWQVGDPNILAPTPAIRRSGLFYERFDMSLVTRHHALVWHFGSK